MKKISIALLFLFSCIMPVHAQFSRITSVTGLQNNDTQDFFAASPFTIKAGPNCTWTTAMNSTIHTFDCSGGGGISGTIASTQIAFGTAADTIGGDAQLTWDNTTKRQFIGTSLTLPMILNINQPSNTDSFLVERETGNAHFASTIIGQATTTAFSSNGAYITGIGLGSEGAGTGAQIEGYEAPGMGESVTQNGAGVFGFHANYGVGTLTTSAAFRGFSSNLTTGTITNAISFFGQTATNPGAGTVTNAYTFYGQPQTAGSTSNYTFFSESGQNFLRSPNFGDCQGLLCLAGNGYGNADNLGDKTLLDLNVTGFPYHIVFRNAGSADADVYAGMNMGTTGNFFFTATNDNMTFTNYTVNPTTRRFRFDDGFGGSVSFPTAPRYDTLDNCADSAGAAACGTATAGVVVIDAGATTVTVSTSSVGNAAGHRSRVFIQENPAAAVELGITCNTTLARTYAVTTVTDGASFVITASAAPVTNPACLSYFVVN